MLKHFLELKNSSWLKSKPWLVLGKGPSSSLLNHEITNKYHILSLNHALKISNPKVAHAIDLSVVHDCCQYFIDQAEIILLPWQPHINCKPTHHTLEELVKTDPYLKKINEQKDIYYYHASTGSIQPQNLPSINVVYFSAEAGINILAELGILEIKSLGVDGGQSYNEQFDQKDKLVNGQNSFDKQFQSIANSILKYNLDYRPLTEKTKIRVFVGSMREQWLASKVLEYSIKKQASMSVDVCFMYELDRPYPLPKEKKNWPRTPFSFQRFLIPEQCDFSGKAIYVDSDMQVFDDIKNLWDIPFNGNDLLSVEEKNSPRRSQFSVMLMDCEKLQWNIDQIIRELNLGQYTYENLMMDMCKAKSVALSIPNSWNNLETFSRKTQLLHYTDMITQPWINLHHPYGHLWTEELIEAIDAGFITNEELQREIELGYVRPSIDLQVKEKILNPVLIFKHAKELDANFLPPYQSPRLIFNPMKSPYLYLKAVIREKYTKSPIKKMTTKISQRLL
jgi:lipopolysaccharide biosynthesis glycosyltransferase